MGGHAEQRADGDDAGAADPGDENVVGAIERWRGRQRQIGEQRRRIGRGAIGLTKLAVGNRSALTIARVTPRSARLSAGMLVATTMSQPRMRLAPPGAMRTVARSSACGAMRT